ncbi:LLM class flavin-dependent oxidoreductase [Cohnella faecalis]|uniref:LLM class flavin-dependent oxidoreductase n=1 Tax=Cohnella faecalis TaxID=2315694 RepID=A0A398CLV6_9BACL|nr:LLM class flavin-dependent oxidoreductase [Cohnella faecalis]RIE03425.1 LLM class flavin-dependent oxidoreductase [Cohnella faecalis]
MIKLSVLDHTHVAEGLSVKQSLELTVRLAQEAERLGYTRFWVPEHHSMLSIASSSPEVMIAHLAARTETIRIGSGGVMLPHYSAYKVAENFRLLEALYPGRIDLGVGRAPGGMPIATRALQEGKIGHVDLYGEQIADLAGYLHDSLPESHRFAGLQASPAIPTAPELWLLGSSGGSAHIAAAQGTGFAYAQFFGVPGSEDAVPYYEERFKPSQLNEKPKALSAVFVICADTEEEADRLGQSADLFFLLLETGRLRSSFPSAQAAAEFPYTELDKERMKAGRRRRFVGTPAQVKARLTAYANQYGLEELMIVTMVHDFEARLNSFRLLSEAFGLLGNGKGE